MLPFACVWELTNKKKIAVEMITVMPFWALTWCRNGGCARGTSGSQNLAVLPKRHENSLFFAANKNKDNAKVSLTSSNNLLENSGFNLTKNRYFVQNNTTIILAGDNRRTTSRTLATHFSRQIRSLETQNVAW